MGRQPMLNLRHAEISPPAGDLAARNIYCSRLGDGQTLGGSACQINTEKITQEKILFRVFHWKVWKHIAAIL